MKEEASNKKEKKTKIRRKKSERGSRKGFGESGKTGAMNEGSSRGGREPPNVRASTGTSKRSRKGQADKGTSNFFILRGRNILEKPSS